MILKILRLTSLNPLLTIKKSLKIIRKLLIIPKHITTFIGYLLTKNKSFKYDISIVAIVKNEAPYICEWLEYHLIIGVKHFYIYDNESEDNLLGILDTYIRNDIVTYKYFPGKAMQQPAYNDALRKYKFENKYLAIIDIDEFILPMKRNLIIDEMNDILSRLKTKRFLSLKIHWVCFGYCGHEKKPDGLVIENYTKSCGDDDNGKNVQIKSIVNPRTIVEYYIHNGLHFFGLQGVNERGIKIKHYQTDCKLKIGIEHLRINHYFSKSYEEFINKVKRGYANKGGTYSLPAYAPNYLSTVDDNSIERFIPLVKQKLLDHASGKE